MRRIYEAASLAPPEIVWVASPLAIAEQWLVARRRAEEDPSDVCWIAERPSVIRLEDGRLLETENTPALVYRDGFSVRPTSRRHASR